MPGAPAPFIDTWAPAQYVVGGTGGSGPIISPDTTGDTVSNAQSQNYDSMLHWKLAGTIILALVTVFVLQQLGFRFVVAAGVGS